MSEELKAFAKWYGRRNVGIEKPIYDSNKEDLKRGFLAGMNTRTDINAEMLAALKDCVEFQCQTCIADRPDDCINPITCSYYDYKSIIKKCEKT